MTLEERVRLLEDRAAIMELISAYALGVSHRDREAVLRCFAPDGVFDVGPVRVSGRDEIRKFLQDLRPDTPHLAGFDQATGSTPTNSNILIECDGDRARSTSTAVVVHAGSRGGEPIVMVRGTEYQDDLARIDGEWLFTSRRHRTVWEFEAKGSEPTPPPRWPR
jgi:ketosteroid isomerase-like protein